MAYSVGDVVKLLSGGPEMTVVAVDNDSSACTCGWFAGTRYVERTFSIETIVKADSSARAQEMFANLSLDELRALRDGLRTDQGEDVDPA